MPKSLLASWDHLRDSIYNAFILPRYFHGVDLSHLVPYLALIGIFGFSLSILPFLIWIERVALGLVQDRTGPNRVGPRGLLQPSADVLKLFFKEDFQPKSVDKRLYYIAPFLTVMIALSAGAVLPLANITFRLPNGTLQNVPLMVANVNIGLLYMLAASSLGVYGIVLAGWASNNKYSLIGGLRAAAQVISYELAMGLALLCVVVQAGTVNLGGIVYAQDTLPFGLTWLPPFLKGSVFSWFWLQSLIVPVILYTIAMIAETNRAPFDLPEAESELVAGFHTEYSAMKFAAFFAGEYINMLAVCALNAAVFWGGWLPPFNCFPFTFIPGFVWFILKIMSGICLYVWLRGTLPRLRYDALMNLGWKKMLPIALIWLFVLAGYSLIRQIPVHLAGVHYTQAAMLSGGK